ncbi:MAG: cyclic nucleotide-binding domain-containing protein [Actinomycetota bacterium]|nr:cyclic nucleotide-binding domain-containing protein [Actinomycetota bacterium]
MVLSRRLVRARDTELVVADGDYLVREGDAGTDMFIIESGAVEISKHIAGRQMVLGVLKRGDFFGEMSLLESLPREADARAVGETRLVVLSQGGLLLRLRRDPTFCLEMLHRLSGRLRDYNTRLGTSGWSMPAEAGPGRAETLP